MTHEELQKYVETLNYIRFLNRASIIMLLVSLLLNLNGVYPYLANQLLVFSWFLMFSTKPPKPQ